MRFVKEPLHESVGLALADELIYRIGSLKDLL
jgi:hypothetical protein